jgi:peptidoglycan/LPS O-acetylase OafA/YrhL
MFCMPQTADEKKPGSRPENRIEWLDSLRGIASLMVVLLHYYHRILLALIPTIAGGTIAIQAALEKKVLSHTLDFYRQTPFYDTIGTLTPFIYGAWDLGKIGVVAFFFISGYVIAYTLNRLKEQPVQAFIVSRLFRLYPVFWVALSLMLTLRFLAGHVYPLGQILANFTMFNKFLLVPDINGVAWTLQIELTFYIIAIVLFMQGFSKNAKAIVAAIYAFLALAFGMSVIKHQTGIDLPLAFPLGLSVMFTGWYWRLSHENPDIPQTKIALVAGSFLPIWWVTFTLGYAPHAMTYFNSYLVAMCLVTAFALLKIKHPVLRFFGNISYSLYLVHDIIGLHVFPWLMALSLQDYNKHFWLTALPFSAVACCAIAVSALLYHFVEKPGVEAGKKLTKTLRERISKKWQSQPARF